MEEIGLSDKKMTDVPSKIFICAIFLAYPLVFHDYYYDIVTCKYFTLIMATLLLLAFTMMTEGKKFLQNIHLMPADYAVISLLLINILSVIGSENKIYALNGADGRFNGLVTVILYCIIYFIISRGEYDKDRFYLILAAGSILVSAIGILNFADIDILGFYDGLQMEQKQFYISTLGHVNVYSGYFSLTIPVLLIHYLEAAQVKRTIFYFMASVINIIALLCGGCESAAVILITAGVCSLLYCKKLNMIKWTVILFFVLMLNKVCIFVNNRNSEPRILSSTVKFLGDNGVIAGATILYLCFTFVWLLIKQKQESMWLKYLLVVLGVLIPVIYVLLFVYFSVFDRTTDLYRMENFLRFSDKFGSYRGYIWRVVLKEFRRLSPYQTLFGIGTDTLLPYLAERYGEDMYNVTMAYYDNAHNEYLQYLITTGIAGVAAYISVLFFQIQKAMKKKDKVILCGVICYLVQSVININQTVTTPLFVVMVSML